MTSQTSATAAGHPPAGDVAGILSRRGVRYAFAFVVYVAVTCVYFAPLLSHLDSRVLQDHTVSSDSIEAIRTFDVLSAAGATPFTFRHDALNGAPEGMPQLTQPAIAQPIQPSVILVLRDFVGTVAAFNLFLLSGFVLTALAGFVLLDWAQFGLLPSLFGGWIVAFNPWLIESAIFGHFAFLHGWALILVLAALTRLLRARTLGWAVLAGLAYGFSFLLSAYMGLLATAFVIAFVIVDLGLQKAWPERLWTCTLVVVTGGVTFLFLIPGMVAFLLDRSVVSSSLTHGLASLQVGGARLDDYVLPVPRQPVLGFLSHLRREDIYHQRIFVGYVVLGLAAVTVIGLVRGRVRLPTGVARSLVLLAAVTVPVALVASMPATLTVLGVGIPMPSYFVGQVTTFYRFYSRFGYVVEIGLAVLAAAALDQLLHRSRRGRVLAVTLVAVAVFEFLPGTLPTVAVGSAPAYDTWLAREPTGIAAHYPLITDELPAQRLAASELYYQRFTLQPLYEIYGAAARGTREDAIRLVSRYVDRPNSLGVLAAEGVRYVVLHDDVYRAVGQKPPTLGSGVRLLRTFGPVRIYRLTAKPIDVSSYLKEQAATIAELFGLARPTVTFAGGFYAPETFQAYNTPFRWMGASGEVDVENTEPAPVRIWLDGLGFSNRVERRLDLRDQNGKTIASTTVPTSIGSIRLGPFAVPSGTSRLTLAPSPGPLPLGAGDSRKGSVYLSDLTAPREPDLSRSLRK